MDIHELGWIVFTIIVVFLAFGFTLVGVAKAVQAIGRLVRQHSA
jgi:hypothetical protein